MRANCRSAVMVVSVASATALAAWLAPSLALALPTAPYQTPAYQATDPGVAIDAPRTPDRYGGGGAHPAPRPVSPQAPPARLGLGAPGGTPSGAPAPRYLGWSGKTAQQAPAAPQAQGAWASVPRLRQAVSAPLAARANAPYAAAPNVRAAASAPVGAPAPVGAWRPYRQASVAPQAPAPQPPAPQAAAADDQAIPMPGPPVGGWRPYAPAEGAPPPRSIYDNAQAPPASQPSAAPQAVSQAAPQAATAAAPPQQLATAQPYRGGARFYSLHRDYGMTPDAIPIPPQFFGPTADLSSPPADPPLKRVTTSTGATRTQEVAADDQGGQ